MRVTQAVVLVGGKGTRLGAEALTTPKPLLEVAPGLRFLDMLLFELARHGLTDIILLAGHLGETVEAAYAGKRVLDATVTVLRETTPQGTGGALLVAADRLDPWFLMSNGDSLFEFNYRRLLAGVGPDITARLALREVPDPARYGAVTLENGRVTQFREKSADLKGPALINGGVYALSRDVLGMIDGPCSIEQDVFPRLAGAGRLGGEVFDGYFLDIGLPDTLEQARREIPSRTTRPCVFLDRDGVLNRDHGYTHRPEDLDWAPGAREAVRLINESGRYAIVVTNQAGVARGYFEEPAVHAFHARMREELADAGAHIDAFYHCPFHEDGSVARYRIANHPDRKPNPGMLLRAMAEWPIRKQGSFLIGDRPSDLAAAASAGVPGVHYSGDEPLDALVARLLEDPAA